MPTRLATASMMRRLAWCGTIQVTSSSVSSARLSSSSVRHRLRAGRHETAAGGYIEGARPLTVHVADMLEDAGLVIVRRLDEHDARAIAEQDGRRAVRRIDHARHA